MGNLAGQKMERDISPQFTPNMPAGRVAQPPKIPAGLAPVENGLTTMRYSPCTHLRSACPPLEAADERNAKCLLCPVVRTDLSNLSTKKSRQ